MAAQPVIPGNCISTARERENNRQGGLAIVACLPIYAGLYIYIGMHIDTCMCECVKHPSECSVLKSLVPSNTPHELFLMDTASAEASAPGIINTGQQPGEQEQSKSRSLLNISFRPRHESDISRPNSRRRNRNHAYICLR